MNDSSSRCEKSKPSIDQSSVANECLDKVEVTSIDTTMFASKYEDLIKQIPIVKSYMRLPAQHPIRFLGLCAQVFFYFLAYGYLQVCLFCRE